MTVNQLRIKVNERANELLLLNLYPRAVQQHSKHSWPDCDCTYCQEKRRVTHSLNKVFVPKALGELYCENEIYFNRKRFKVKLKARLAALLPDK